jgi:tetratricopeptide (TPR) repeat protein
MLQIQGRCAKRGVAHAHAFQPSEDFMRTTLSRAAFAACLLGTAAVVGSSSAAFAAAEAKPAPEAKVSPAVGKLLDGAGKLMAVKDYAGAMVLIKQAQAVPDQTPFDTYKVNNFLGIDAFNLNDHATADVAFEAMADSPAMPDAEKVATLHNAVLLASEAKHYDKATKYADTFFAAGGTPDATLLAVLSQDYFRLNDFAKAEATALKSIAATAAGTAPNRGALEIALASQLKQNRAGDALKTLETIVTFYNEPDEWGQLIDVSLGSVGTKNIKSIDALQVYRLLLATKATGAPDDWTSIAEVALQTGYPAEAQAALEAGIAAGKLSTSGKTATQHAEARSRVAKDRVSLSTFEAAATKSASGELDVKLAETYYSYGRYADVVTAARRGLAKGGPKTDANEANLLIGMALAMQGNNADAVTALNNVKGASAAVMKAAHLWSVYAGRKYTPAAAAPASP